MRGQKGYADLNRELRSIAQESHDQRFQSGVCRNRYYHRSIDSQLNGSVVC